MDGTLALKKYNLVERVKALEEASGSSAKVEFSTEEKEIGTWINGDKLFERSFVLIENNVAKYEHGGLENKSYLIGLTGFDVAFISNFVGVRDVAIDSMPIANTSYYTFDRTNGAIFVSSNFSFIDLVVTLRYTKSRETRKRSKNRI